MAERVYDKLIRINIETNTNTEQRNDTVKNEMVGNKIAKRT